MHPEGPTVIPGLGDGEAVRVEGPPGWGLQPSLGHPQAPSPRHLGHIKLASGHLG